MNYSNHYFSLDIHEVASQVSLTVKKNETNRKLNIMLTENGQPYEIGADCAVVFSGKKADGKILYNECLVKNNVIEYIFTPQTASATGIVECEIIVYGGNSQVLYNPSFSIVVYTPSFNVDDDVESTDEFSALTQVMSRLESAIMEAEATLETAKKLLPKKVNLTLLGSAWSDAEKNGIYTQEVEIQGVTATTQIDLTPSDEQIKLFENIGFVLSAKNIDGRVVISSTEILTENITIQATLKNVSFEEETI